MSKESRRSILLGAAFLMATSAIGPGFLTQTTVFTAQLGASFAFAILLSILIDLAAQLNIWRVITVSGRRAQDIADQILPGLGALLTVLVVLGGLAFNIGNVGGAGLGLNALLDLPVAVGATLSAVIAIAIFLSREAGKAMDRFAQVLGVLMVGLTVYVAIASHPPVAEAALRAVAPTHLDWLTVITLVGGTVGGYITFAGGHRLVDAGVTGIETVPRVTRAASTGVLIASIMRVVLFLAALGVVTAGAKLDPANPPASVFLIALGGAGRRVFGLVMWAAAITSVVGAAYTSVSFLRSMSATVDRRASATIVAFIVVSTLIHLLIGRPVRVLILVGALNGLILPLGLTLMLIAAYSRRIVGAYRHPLWLGAAGGVVALAVAAMGVWTLATQLPLLWR